MITEARSVSALLTCLILFTNLLNAQQNTRPRARDLGLKIGILQPGSLNSITDIQGVAVGHTSIIRGDNVRTGVTAILEHGGNLFQQKVPGPSSSVTDW